MELTERIEAAVTKAVEYAWETQNDSKGWPAVAGRNSHILDTGELLYGLLATIRRYDPKLKGVHDYIANTIQMNSEAWNLQESPRIYNWAQLALFNLGDAMDNSIMKYVASKIQKFHIPGEGWRPREGYPSNVYDTALSVIVRHTLEQTDQAYTDSVEYLVVQQNMDGGWGSEKGHRSNPMSTAIALLALTLTKTATPAVINPAIQWIRKNQLTDGSWPLYIESLHVLEDFLFLSFPTPWMVSALLAAGVDYNDAVITKAIEYLLELQNPDGGFPFYRGFPWSEGEKSTTWSTGFTLKAFQDYLKEVNKPKNE